MMSRLHDLDDAAFPKKPSFTPDRVCRVKAAECVEVRWPDFLAIDLLVSLWPSPPDRFSMIALRFASKIWWGSKMFWGCFWFQLFLDFKALVNLWGTYNSFCLAQYSKYTSPSVSGHAVQRHFDVVMKALKAGERKPWLCLVVGVCRATLKPVESVAWQTDTESIVWPKKLEIAGHTANTGQNLFPYFYCFAKALSTLSTGHRTDHAWSLQTLNESRGYV